MVIIEIMGHLTAKKYLVPPSLLILQKYLPLKAHISLLITATASKLVSHLEGTKEAAVVDVNPKIVFTYNMYLYYYYYLILI